MKKSAKIRKQSACKARSHRSRKPRGAGTKPAKLVLIRTVRGVDDRGIPYRKDIFTGSATTYYGPLLGGDEECSISCCLVKQQKAGQRAKWRSYGPDVTLLRGDMAKTALQGRWDTTGTMVLVRSMESVRDHPERWHELDGSVLRSAMFCPEMESEFRAALRALHGGGLVREDELPRTLRISRAVVEAAKVHDRPPTPREVFTQFVMCEKAEGREVWVPKTKDALEPDLWKTKAQASFYKALPAAGWGWLIDSP